MLQKPTNFIFGFLVRPISNVVIAYFWLCCACWFSGSALASPDWPYSESSSTDLSAFVKWTTLLRRFESQRAERNAHCGRDDCIKPETYAHWDKIIAAQRSSLSQEAMAGINKALNSVKYRTDTKNFGKSDFWQTPLEFLQRSGDCEDYAIAKYFALKELGFSEDIMRVVVVKDLKLGIPHAVLWVKTDGEELMLDNQIKKIMPFAKAIRYKPVFAINEARWSQISQK